MRSLMICVGAVALFGSAAVAEDVIVAPAPGAVIEHRATDETTTSKTITRDDERLRQQVRHAYQRRHRNQRDAREVAAAERCPGPVVACHLAHPAEPERAS